MHKIKCFPIPILWGVCSSRVLYFMIIVEFLKVKIQNEMLPMNIPQLIKKNGISLFVCLFYFKCDLHLYMEDTCHV